MSQRQLAPPIAGVIRSRLKNHIHFQFVAAGTIPHVVLSNHGLGEEARLEAEGRPLRFRFLAQAAGPHNRWERTDAAEPVVDFADGSDPVSDQTRQLVHDECLDAWEAYLDQKPECVTYARLTQINNDIVQLDEKLSRLRKQVTGLEGKRKNLEVLEASLKSGLPANRAAVVSDEEREILVDMATENCWLSLTGEESAELHPYNSPQVLRSVDMESAKRLAVLGFVQLHRYLAGNRTVFKIADRGHQLIEGGGCETQAAPA